MIFEYITSPNGTIHLMRGDGVRTLCGRDTTPAWTIGDETIHGRSASCRSCRISVGDRSIV